METKPNKFQQGKIYAIRSPHTDKIYIGSTTQKYLCHRLGGHVAHFKKWKEGLMNKITSFNIIEAGDYYIELVENYPCQDKHELRRREGEVIRAMPNAINRLIAGRTRSESHHDYYEANKTELLIKHKQYREEHIEVMRQQTKDWSNKRVKCPHCEKEFLNCTIKKHIKRMHKEVAQPNQQVGNTSQTLEKNSTVEVPTSN